MTIHLGNMPASSTIYIPFHTFDANGASVTMTGFAVGDILIYKNGSTTQRSSTTGFTLLDTDGIDFDALTGIHGFSVDLSDNTDAGFFAVGSFYWIVVSSITVSAQTVSFVAATFRIVAAESVSGKIKADVDAWNGTAVSAPATAGIPEVNLKNIANVAVSTSTAQLGVNVVNNAGSAITAASGVQEVKVASIAASAITATSIATDAITAAKIADAAIDAATFAASAITATVIAADAITAAKIADGAIDAATFAAGAINAAAIATDAITAAKIAADAIGASELAADAVTEIQSGLATAAALTTVDDFLDTEIADIQARLPAALVSGRIDASVGAMAAGVLTATAIAADAITDAKVASDVTIASVTGAVGSVTGAVGSVTGAVGSVTGNVGGNVTGSVGSIATGGIAAASFVAGAIDATAIATDAFGALEVAAGAASEIATAVRTELTTELARVDVAVSTRLASASYTAPLDAAGTRSAVGLASANLDTQLTAIDDFLDTEIAAILAAVDTEVATIVTATGASAIRAAVGLASANLDTQLDALPTNAELATALGTADDAVLAQVALVKAKTDNLPSDPADASVIAGRFDTLDTSVADLPTNVELATALGTADDAVLTAISGIDTKIGTPTDTDIATDIANLAAGSGGLDAAGVRAAIGLASANLDTQLDALPTNGELATALGTADDAVLAQIALVKAKTDSLTFSTANVVDAHVKYVAGEQVVGAGTEADPWGPV